MAFYGDIMCLNHIRGVLYVNRHQTDIEIKEILEKLNAENRKYVLGIAQALAFSEENNNKNEKGEKNNG